MVDCSTLSKSESVDKSESYGSFRGAFVFFRALGFVGARSLEKCSVTDNVDSGVSEDVSDGERETVSKFCTIPNKDAPYDDLLTLTVLTSKSFGSAVLETSSIDIVEVSIVSGDTVLNVLSVVVFVVEDVF